MSARRKIAGWLRRLAARVDDRSIDTNAEAVARLQAVMAMPRQISRYVQRHSFVRGAERNPLAVEIASQLEAQSPGVYLGNAPMVAAIAAHRLAGGV